MSEVLYLDGDMLTLKRIQNGNISKRVAARIGIEASFLASFAATISLKPSFSNFISKVFTTVSNTTFENKF